MNIFEIAARNKVRFSSGQGMISVEDLFDLPLTSTVAGKASLDNIGKVILRALKTTEEESLITPAAPVNELLQLQLEIVKHIIDVKQSANAALLAAKDKKLKTQKIMAIMAKKQDAALEESSMEDLQKLLDEL